MPVQTRELLRRYTSEHQVNLPLWLIWIIAHYHFWTISAYAARQATRVHAPATISNMILEPETLYRYPKCPPRPTLKPRKIGSASVMAVEGAGRQTHAQCSAWLVPSCYFGRALT